MRDDPLEDIEPGPPTSGPCDCDNGWRQVSARYAERLAPDTPAELWHNLSAAEQARRGQAQHALRRALEDSWYPCRRCRPEAFGRWLERSRGGEHAVKPARVGPRERERRDIA